MMVISRRVVLVVVGELREADRWLATGLLEMKRINEGFTGAKTVSGLEPEMELTA